MSALDAAVHVAELDAEAKRIERHLARLDELIARSKAMQERIARVLEARP